MSEIEVSLATSSHRSIFTCHAIYALDALSHVRSLPMIYPKWTKHNKTAITLIVVQNWMIDNRDHLLIYILRGLSDVILSESEIVS